MGDRLPDPAEEGGFAAALGHAIKVERTARGIGRKDLAARAGLSYPYLSEIENGSKRASSKALALIARALDLAPSDLLRLAETWDEQRAAHGIHQAAPLSVSSTMSPRARRSWFHGAMPDALDTRAEQLSDLMMLLEQLSDDDLARLRDLVERLARG